MCLFIKSNFFWWVTIETNIRNIAMHPFPEIILLWKVMNFSIFLNSLKIWPFRNETKSVLSIIKSKVKILNQAWEKYWRSNMLGSLSLHFSEIMGHMTIGNCRNVIGLGKSMVVFRLFEKLRYWNERSTKFENLYQE